MVPTTKEQRQKEAATANFTFTKAIKPRKHYNRKKNIIAQLVSIGEKILLILLHYEKNLF